MRQLELLGINQLLVLIRREPEGSELRERALRRCLDELIEVEIEWRLDYRHLNLGHHNVSTIANMGEGRGGVTGRVDHVGEAAERFRYACRWRHMAKALLGHVNERQRMALLLAGYAIPEQRQAIPGGDRGRLEAIKQGHRGLTLAEVRDAQLIVLQRLGWSVFAGYSVNQWSACRVASWSLSPIYDPKRQKERMKSWQAWFAQEVFATKKALERTAEKARAKLLYVVGEQAKLAA
ncbi:hypothetical protein R5R73_04825 [Salinicola sp. LHM]|uniref:hypothetical protein n=1 Tax=Salinicola sp. LHM TaxID=3065298 RepID=UPI002ACECE50|nr:hypothetical protein [Salinicola sp. LHM]WQH34013.1 hypothetical protein R5R73_04825 [Salinicola sp. LHM]